METQQHFDTIAASYRQVRYTDPEPIAYIAQHLGVSPPLLNAIEVGCGTGRYTNLLIEQFKHMQLVCVDASAGMLKELATHLDKIGYTHYQALHATVEETELPPQQFDVVFTFNAVHHFNLPLFLQKVNTWLKIGGQAFIYTRFRHQNAQSIWGRYFPNFAAKETRLMSSNEIKSIVAKIPTLTLQTHEFTFSRQASLDTLLEKVDKAHYSTFRLYEKAELAHARTQFIRALTQTYNDVEAIEWVDHNVMIHLHKQA